MGHGDPLSSSPHDVMTQATIVGGLSSSEVSGLERRLWVARVPRGSQGRDRVPPPAPLLGAGGHAWAGESGCNGTFRS